MQSELDQYFRFKCEKGFRARELDKLPPDQLKIYRDRLEYEIKSITEMGFAGYFLIVQDIIKWAKSNDVPVGPGRGSVAGSIAAYCLGITEVESVKYDLIFERFINPGRIGKPIFKTSELSFQDFVDKILPSVDIDLSNW